MPKALPGFFPRFRISYAFEMKDLGLPRAPRATLGVIHLPLARFEAPQAQEDNLKRA